ncbi:plant invertase/pectin methylesterase inhibitor superfamily [Actinidia rufa]|uniref:Pectinesterase n=1 Tax=Actinidia rufa TaxID=165716 RepID=A0A7J0D9U9_9ERIC|nr:plant invertase/pectin methylesterase inhibitor superfamily [Actinidia rufa]
MAVGKVVASFVSILLVVGVVIGVVAFANNRNGANANKETATVSTSSKAVTSICATTNYKDACMNSLGNVAKNESATPKDYILAAIQAAIEEAQKSFNITESIKFDFEKNPTQKMAVDDCKDLLESAVEDLQAAFSMVGDSELHTLNDRVFEVLNWFTAVVSYQQSCLDELEVPELKSPIENGMLNATQLTSNAINIVAKITEILQAFNINIDSFKTNSTNSRKLLQVTEVGHDGYPTWFPVADRKLLEAHAGHRHGGHHHQAAGGARVTPNAVVAQDGSGQYKTISAAVAAIPTKHQGRWIIYVKAGIYSEYVTIPKSATDVFMYGDGPTRTIVTGSKNFAIRKIPTMQTATFAVVGKGFIAKGMGFRNTAGTQGHQAVAFRSQSDMSAYVDCRFEGYQDTLYYQSNRQLYRNCFISGTVDFIFGRGTALIQNSEIQLRMPEPNQQNTVTADGNHEENGIAGLVLQNCRITAEPELFPKRLTIKNYLGRPWDKFSTTAVIESEIGDLIQPEGWMVWATAPNHETATVVEYGNRGAGANTNKRVKWRNFKAITNKNEALKYTASILLEGGKTPSKWLAGTGVPVDMSLIH